MNASLSRLAPCSNPYVAISSRVHTAPDTCLQPKAQLAPYLDAEREGKTLPEKPDRKAELLLVKLTSPYNAVEVVANLSTGSVEKWFEVAEDHVSALSGTDART